MNILYEDIYTFVLIYLSDFEFLLQALNYHLLMECKQDMHVTQKL